MNSAVLGLGVALAAFSALAVADPAWGASLAYQESVSGDLPTFAAGPPLALDIGANTVSGRLGAGFGPPSDFDSFSVSLQAGMILTAIEVAFVTTKIGEAVPGAFFQISDDLAPSGWFLSPIPLFGFAHSSQTSPVTVVSDNLPRVGADVLTVQSAVYSCDCMEGNGWFADYTWTFTVEAAAIPEPSTLAVLAASLIGLAFARRRPT